MEKSLRQMAFCVLCLSLFIGLITAAEPNNPVTVSNSAKAAVIDCKGMIDDGLYRSIRRRSQIALEDGAEFLIYEIGTYGGFLQSADDISKYFILDIGKKAHTVAYVKTEAISAGAMISVSCQDIVMRENTTIGDCAPITTGGKLEGVEREKAESFTRAAFMRAAEANGYPPALLKAMVTMQNEVYRVKNLKTGKYEFLESQDLPDDPNMYELDKKELVVRDNEILTLTASQALEYGIARAVVNDLDGVLDFLAKQYDVTFIGKPIMLKTNWSEEMVRWLNSPEVMAVLVLLALLGVYIEFSTPGIGLPGLVAAICFALIIGSKFLIGLANWVEVLVFLVGVILLMVEVFILPGFGIAGVLGIIFIFAGIFGMLIKNPPGELPWPQTDFGWTFFTNGILSIVVGFAGFIALAAILSKYLPRIRFLSGLTLIPNVPGTQRISMTATPDTKKSGLSVGNIGRVVTTLRPAGKAKIGNAIVDVVAEAEFIEKGTKIKILKISGNKVVVKQITEDDQK